MAVLALHLVLAGVDVVTEEYRLARALQAATVGGSEDRSGDGVDTGRGLLGERSVSTEDCEGSDASGRNATDDECQLTNHHLTDEEEPGTHALGQRAPKYSVDIGLNNPIDILFRPFQSASLAALLEPPPWSRGARRGAGRSDSHSAFRRARLKKTSTARRSSSSNQHHLTGPVRCPS